MAQRAPNRDLVDRYDGRDAGGNRRQYFRRWNTLEKWKWGLTGLALLAGVGWLAAGPVGRIVGWSGGAYRYSHGPLASVHAAWDANCEACHRGFGESQSASLNPFAVQHRWLDLTCEKCHAGPAHHASVKEGVRDTSCASCHHDHNGRANSLVRIADTHCTQCHANLGETHAAGKSEYANAVTDFAGHPDFRKLADEKAGRKHERTIRFSHALHMAPGVVAAESPAADRGAKRLKDLAPADAARYRQAGQKDDDAVQLTCASCHQLDAGRAGPNGDSALLAAVAGQPREAVLPPRAGGAYFLPINFDAHCKACHPLGVTVDVSGAKQKGTTVEVPHRKQPAELRDLLRGEYTRRLLDDNPDLGDRPAVPFRRLNPEAGRPDEVTKKFRQAVDDAVTKATAKLFGQTNPASGGRTGATCTQCHDLTAEKAVQPVRIPTVWFEHAKFDHVAHRGAACSECHPSAYSTAEGRAKVAKNEPGWEREAINILGVESCKACHGPPHPQAVNGVTVQAGGVRHGCTDCHRYHAGDHPLQGRGSPLRDPLAPLTTAEFLLGRPRSN